jgi:hypothetical protein
MELFLGIALLVQKTVGQRGRKIAD